MTQPQQKISKKEFRERLLKEKMLNGKTFEQCSRMDLFMMLASALRQVGILTRKLDVYEKGIEAEVIEPDTESTESE
jgi:hypothetical protein